MNLEEMKKKFDGGEYILVSQTQFLSGRFTKWEIKKNIVTSSNHLIHQKLIHKKHEHILNAYLTDDGVGIKRVDYGKDTIGICEISNFIEQYDENIEYRLKETKKMIDLRNTWCEATEENFNALLKLGLYEKSVWSWEAIEKHKAFKKSDLFLIKYKNCNNNFRWAKIEYPVKQSGKQIHLVNGKFEYVENNNVEHCQFAKYGFEKPEFECEILAKRHGRFFGYVRDEKPEPARWNKNGYYSLDEKYNLTPLKEWYETKKVQDLLKELLKISEDEELNQVLKAHILKGWEMEAEIEKKILQKKIKLQDKKVYILRQITEKMRLTIKLEKEIKVLEKKYSDLQSEKDWEHDTKCSKNKAKR